jgi:hypothetical protein
MNFHNLMMNIPANPYSGYDGKQLLAYKYGHKDARHAAAEIALKADIRIEELEEALRDVVQQYENVRAAEGYPSAQSESTKRAKEILAQS